MKIICMGDSIMQYNDYTTYPQSGWVQLFDRFFTRDVKFINFARNGRSSKSFIAEGRFEKVLNAVEKDDYVIVQFGHNDEKSADLERYTSPAPGGEFEGNLCFFVDEIRKAGGVPLLLTPVARRKFDSDGNVEDTHGEYPKAVLKVCKDKNLPVIDITCLTMQLLSDLGEQKSRSLYLNFDEGIYDNFPSGKEDNSHLRCDGAYAVSKIIAQQIALIDDRYSEYKALKESLILRDFDRAALDNEISDEKVMA